MAGNIQNRDPRRGGGRPYTESYKEFWCHKFVEAQRAYDISATEFAEQIGVASDKFCLWLRQRGIDWESTLMAASRPHKSFGLSCKGWRHGGITTPRADRNGVGVE